MRRDFHLIASLVNENSRVLDIGCGDGTLLTLLQKERMADVRGLDTDTESVQLCMRQGLTVIQGDANTDLAVYPTNAFDFSVLSLTLPYLADPADTLTHMLRIARHAIVSLPNLGYWRHRLRLLLLGRVPTTTATPWHKTRAIHPCTLRDFSHLCAQNRFHVEKCLTLPRGIAFPNLRAPVAVFLLTQKEKS